MTLTESQLQQCRNLNTEIGYAHRWIDNMIVALHELNYDNPNIIFILLKNENQFHTIVNHRVDSDGHSGATFWMTLRHAIILISQFFSQDARYSIYRLADSSTPENELLKKYDLL